MMTADHLTASEMRVLHLRAQGLAVGEVSIRLGLAHQTVKNHITGAYEALEVDNLASALIAVGWLRPPDVTPPVSETCGWVGECGRPRNHRGEHDGFRPTGENT